MKTLGIDWGHKELCLALADERGHWITTERRPTDAMPQMLKWLRDLGGPDEIVVTIESGAPLITHTLRAHGYDVAEITPLLAGKLAELHSPSGAKDDARDARTLARARAHQQRGLVINRERDERADELRLLSLTRERHVSQRTRLIQQIKSVLHSAHPGLAALGLDLRTDFARRLIAEYADPLKARRARRGKVERLVRPARRKDLPPERVQASLRDHGYEVPECVARVYAGELRALVEQLDMVDDHIRTLEQESARLLQVHPDVEILMSLPGVGTTLAAAIVARVNGAVVIKCDAKRLQILAGTAPRTRVSGKRSGGLVMRRMHRDSHLHQALVQMAKCSVKTCAWARAFVYDHTGGRMRHAKRRNRAYRALANKWVRIIHHLLRTRTTYDDETHCARLRRNAVPWAPQPAEDAA